MSKFRVIVADCPWPFSDKLRMSKVKRGADDNYDGIMSFKDIKELDVESLADEDCVLALWCPSSMLVQGIETLETWGFKLKQTHIWVKTKNKPFDFIRKYVSRLFRNLAKGDRSYSEGLKELDKFLWAKENQEAEEIGDPDPEGPDNILAFGMGHLFRQTHEIVLIGVRGKVHKHQKNKAQRSVHFYPVTKHSAKPEALQDMLEEIFPGGKRLEMFARRDRNGWTCIGNQCPSSYGEDINDSINRLQDHENTSTRQAV